MIAPHLLVSVFVLLHAAPPKQVALTFDDVPWSMGNESQAVRTARTARMVSVLRARGAPFGILVNCGRLSTPDPQLQAWIDGGATVGNHTTHHRDLNTADLKMWLESVRTCDAKLRVITGHAIRYFRFPMLHEGMNPTQQNAARALLRKLQYRNAHVTIDNSDFLAAAEYSKRLIQGDSVAARRIRHMAVAHDLEATTHFEQVTHVKVGRAIPHVLLLHANAMTADMLPELMDSLSRRGYSFISMDQAYADSVYNRPTCYAGKSGVSFLYRIAPCRSGEETWDVAAQERVKNAIL